MCIKSDIVVSFLVDFIYGTDNGFKYFNIYSTQLATFNTPFHPLFQIIVQPFIYLFKSFISSQRMLFIFVQSFIASLSNCLFYSCLKNLKLSKPKCILFSLIFIFSYSNIVFASLPESHIYDGFINLLMLLYTIELTINKKLKNLDKENILIIIVFNLFSFGINTYNIVISFILTLYILITTYCTNILKILCDILKIYSIVTILIYVLAFCQAVISFDGNSFFNKTGRETEINKYVNTPSNARLKNLIHGTFIEPFYALDHTIEINNTNPKKPPLMWNFAKQQPFIKYLPILGFFLLVFVYSIKNITKIKGKYLLMPLFAIIFLNCISSYFWEVDFCFLFSQNTLCFLLVILALLFEYVPTKITYISCTLFLIYQLIANFRELFQLYMFINGAFTSSTYYKIMIDVILDIVVFSIFLIFLNKIIRKNFDDIENIYKILIPLHFVFMIMFTLFHIQYGGKV